MQSKVSMVMPCYNKVKFVSGMFDSILAQLWDNIELIIVNDGSNDGTRDVITRYEPRFKRRGYEVIVIDQDNQGVAVALLNGLRAVTGDYVCTVDSDDRLDSGYVYVMAHYLDKHPEVNRVMCDYSYSRWRNDQSRGLTKCYLDKADIFPYPIYESQLLFRVTPTCYTNMIRRSYLAKCGLSNYSTLCRTSQEPGFIAIINQNMEQPAYIPRILYCYFLHEGAISTYKGSSEQLEKHYDDYIMAIEESVRGFDISEEYKDRLVGCAKIGMCRHVNSIKSRTENPADTEKKNIKRAINVTRQYFGNLIQANEEQVSKSGFEIFYRALSNRIIRYKSTDVNKLNFSRIIAFGHGRVGRRLLPLLVETKLKPDVIWDQSSNGRYSFDDIPICKPDMNDLKDDDLIILMISDLELAEEIYDLFDGDNRENIIPYSDLLDYLGDWYFGYP